jgi:hypothetical protein
MRHKAVPVWWKPWRSRCACGCAWFPCPDSITMDRPGPQTRHNQPSWAAPTAAYPVSGNERPLMTLGQRWRTRRNAAPHATARFTQRNGWRRRGTDR